MKKIFAIGALAIALVLTGCEQSGGGTEVKTYFTIKNESSYDLSNVIWSGVNFASSGSADLLKGTASKNETAGDASGYVFFTRKDSGIHLRTYSIYIAEESPITITNNILVVEISDESNQGTLSAIQSTVPSGVSATALSISSIQVTWNSVSGADTYTVYRATSAAGTYTSVGTSTATSYTNTGLSGGTTYYYKVSATSIKGEGAQSTYTSTTTLRSAAPTGVTATGLSSSSIQIAWSAVTGASSYTVYCATSATGTYTFVGTSSTTSYTDTSLYAATTYYYTVSASGTDGESYQSAYVSAITVPNAPTLPRITDRTASSIRVYLTYSNPNTFNWYRATSATGPYTLDLS